MLRYVILKIQRLFAAFVRASCFLCSCSQRRIWWKIELEICVLGKGRIGNIVRRAYRTNAVVVDGRLRDFLNYWEPITTTHFEFETIKILYELLCRKIETLRSEKTLLVVSIHFKQFSKHSVLFIYLFKTVALVWNARIIYFPDISDNFIKYISIFILYLIRNVYGYNSSN